MSKPQTLDRPRKRVNSKVRSTGYALMPPSKLYKVDGLSRFYLKDRSPIELT